jgi:hypothetical protein
MAFTPEELETLRARVSAAHIAANPGHEVVCFSDTDPQGWGWGCRQCDPDLFEGTS